MTLCYTKIVELFQFLLGQNLGVAGNAIWKTHRVKNKNQDLYILSEKLISADTIVPLCVFVKKHHPLVSIIYIVPDQKTQNLIAQDPLLAAQ